MRKSKWFVTLAVVVVLSLGVVGAPAAASGLVLLIDPSWLLLTLFAPTHGFPGVSRTLPFVDTSYTMHAADGANSENDVYRVHVYAGQRLELSGRATSGGRLDVYFYDAATETTITGSDGLVASDSSAGLVKRLTYTAPADMDIDINMENHAGATTMPYAAAASIWDPVGNDTSGAASKTLPMIEQNFVDALSAPDLAAADKDDVFGVYLTAGKKYLLSMTGQGDADLLIYKPGTGTVVGNTADIVAQSNTAGSSTENITFTATASGTHYFVVRAKDGKAGRYTLNASEKTVTSITITTTKTSVVRPNIFILQGFMTGGANGDLVIVWVKKPGKSYYSYSSNRLCYNGVATGASWWYRYTPIKKTCPAGTYYFKTSFPGNATKEGSVSPVVIVKMK